MRLYLAGPMRGIANFNFPAFARAADRLRRAGHEVVSPAEMDLAAGFEPACTAAESIERIESGEFDVCEAMLRDIRAILDCDGIVLMPGWERSTGARTERFVAETVGKPAYLAGSVFEPIVPAPPWNENPRLPYYKWAELPHRKRDLGPFNRHAVDL